MMSKESEHMKLQNRVAIVTGSSKGLGEAIALAYAKEGANVVINYYSSKDEAVEVARKVEALGSKSMVYKADTSNKLEVEQMVADVIKKWGKIDILVNNAGVMYNTPFLEIAEEE